MARCGACDAANPDMAKYCLECGTAMVAVLAPADVRKTVTVLFCDVTGSTALGELHDAESMRSVMTRYFAAMSQVVESHGGTVEKFIGDAVMALFGVPVVHEDDALRAVRAAAGMRSAVEAVNDGLERDYGVRLAARIGVNTGEVIVGAGDKGTVATGDAVNLAARLEQAAEPGEILLGQQTWDLVRDAAQAHPVPALTLKGKAEPVAAWRLVDVDVSPTADRRGPGLSSPILGRGRELALLSQALERCTADRRSQLVTVLGAAGVGKSRLLVEFSAALLPDVTLLTGRCLSYGEDIVFWPLQEMLRRAAGMSGGDGDATGRSRLRALVDDDPEADRVVERLAPLAGLAGTPAEAEETRWALGRLVEALGRRGPVVVVLDDVHWAEASLLDVVEHLADWTRDTPLLLVCLARQDLLDERPQWGGGRVNATAVLLEPLGDDETGALLDNLLDGAPLDAGVRARILAAAGGMPLFVEQMLAMLVDDQILVREGGTPGLWSSTLDLGSIDVPPTIAALLAARLDRLPPAERAALEAAAVVGVSFYRDAVAELVADTPTGTGRSLMALVRKEIVRPDRSDLPGEEGFRFLHVLLRDAAYAAVPKSRRADLHERFARWLDKRGEAFGLDVDEFVGHHLEQAVRLRASLGPLDPATRELSAAAAQRLASAGRRLSAADPLSASSFLGRAADLLEPGRPERLANLRDAAAALYEGGSLLPARDRYEQARAEAAAAGDRRIVDLVDVALVSVRSHLEPDVDTPNELAVLDAAMERFRGQDDTEAALVTGLAKMELLNELALWRHLVVQTRELRPVAELRGDRGALATLDRMEGAGLFFGPFPIAESLQHIRSSPASVSESPGNLVGRTFAHAAALAYDDRVAESRAELAEGERLVEEVRPALGGSMAAFGGGIAERLLGDLPAAERLLRRGIDALEHVGERGWLSTLAPMLGTVLLERGDAEGARLWAQRGRELSPPADIASQSGWRTLAARVAATGGDLADAVRLADDAVDWAERGDDLSWIGEVHSARAEVLERAGRLDDAASELRVALDCYERKGNRPGARAVRARLAALDR